MTHEIAGARGTVRDAEDVLRRAHAWARHAGVDVCLADARAVFGADHLESSVLHAERARDTGTMTARSLAMETLLYLSGRRQVAEAIRVAGLRNGTTAVAIALLGTSSLDEFLRAVEWTRDDGVLRAEGKSPRALRASGPVRSTMLPGSLSDLALERTALVDVWKD